MPVVIFHMPRNPSSEGMTKSYTHFFMRNILINLNTCSGKQDKTSDVINGLKDITLDMPSLSVLCLNSFCHV